jgi:hypothetical protein
MGLLSPSSRFVVPVGAKIAVDVLASIRLRFVLSALSSSLSEATRLRPNPDDPIYALSSSAFLRALFLERDPPKFAGIKVASEGSGATACATDTATDSLYLIDFRTNPLSRPMSTFGSYFRVTTYGESHCASVGAIIDGTPPVSYSF